MKDMIIKSLELLVWLMVILIVLGALGGGAAMMGNPMGGFLMGLGIMIGGVLYAIIFGGIMFLVIGIHDNTKRTAEALERKG
ncbi:hypothetical protein LGT41_0005880 [Abyssibius alkaniclasticus]|uniref:hypothetical protein n=1 Tax=Abyssibius alkaniclasticus TaxID=2881234 RepID=UPI00236457AE|nr:hypothetical protein [Abyssibius alkaniclasticus]UPH72343.1 hypothetical protein LGT41_0005880 [Abyssibius alkaniclasticus]